MPTRVTCHPEPAEVLAGWCALPVTCMSAATNALFNCCHRLIHMPTYWTYLHHVCAWQIFTLKPEVHEVNALGLPAAVLKRLRADVDSEVVNDCDALHVAFEDENDDIKPPFGRPLPKRASTHRNHPLPFAGRSCCQVLALWHA